MVTMTDYNRKSYTAYVTL